jgi:hypothetical protein
MWPLFWNGMSPLALFIGKLTALANEHLLGSHRPVKSAEVQLAHIWPQISPPIPPLYYSHMFREPRSLDHQSVVFRKS